MTKRNLHTGICAAALAVLTPALGACNRDQTLTDDDTAKGRIGVTVLDYSPMPGQFVNEIPQYAAGDDAAAIKTKAQQLLDKGYLISLGAWGGSVTLKLARPIKAKTDGTPEFRVLGNAFTDGSDARGAYGSSEPGIVQVMHDANANGQPDDIWCTIRPQATFTQGVTVTYGRHKDGDDDEHYIPWTAGDGTTGYLLRYIIEHTHTFFPEWLPASQKTLTATGIMLPPCGVQTAAGKYILYAVPGTADSYANNDPRSALHIADAVLPSGAAANLPQIDFVRIYTGVLQCNGYLGEVSTEVAGIEAL